MIDIFDVDNPPARTAEMEEHGQVWVWMRGAEPPRWEIRGTGLVVPDEWKRKPER